MCLVSAVYRIANAAVACAIATVLALSAALDTSIAFADDERDGRDDAAHTEDSPDSQSTPDTDISSFDWPGYSLDRLRGLPACETKPEPGENWACRPPLPPTGWPVGLGLFIGPGVLDLTTADVTHNALIFGARVEYWPTRWFALGIRGHLLSTGLTAVSDPDDPDDPGTGTGGFLFGTARLRLFTDEVDRDAFTLAGGFGYGSYGRALGAGVEPVARVGLSRDIGWYVSPTGAVTMSLGIEYMAGFGEQQVRALMIAIEVGNEMNIEEPDNVITRDDPPAIDYVAAIHLGLFGFGASIGHAFSRRTRLYVRVDWTGAVPIGDASGGVAISYSLIAGVKYQLPMARDRWYMDLAAGYSLFAADDSTDHAPVADIEFGFSLSAKCATRGGLGLRVRNAYDDGRVGLATVMLMGNIEWGSSRHAFGKRKGPLMCNETFSGQRVYEANPWPRSRRPDEVDDRALRHIQPGQVDLEPSAPVQP